MSVSSGLPMVVACLAGCPLTATVSSILASVDMMLRRPDLLLDGRLFPSCASIFWRFLNVSVDLFG